MPERQTILDTDFDLRNIRETTISDARAYFFEEAAQDIDTVLWMLYNAAWWQGNANGRLHELLRERGT